jgi:cyclohexa-1,5-dienecarbonyl-CoA hydratase
MRDLLASPLVLLAAVRGKCLGGGLELASFCHRVFASPDASLGQPEVVLGVFAPMASAFLPERVGRPAAEDLCLTGRAVGAAEALDMRLVDEVAQDPGAAALAWARGHLGAKSASSLRHAVRAVRAGLAPRLLAALDAVERQYLDGLMATADAEEGVRAFLEKRSPRWRNA